MMLTMVKGVPTSGFNCLEDKKAPKHLKFTVWSETIRQGMIELEKQAGLKKGTLSFSRSSKREYKQEGSGLVIGWAWTVHYKTSKRNLRKKITILGHVFEPRARCGKCNYLVVLEVNNNCSCSTSFIDGKCSACGREVQT